MMLQTKELLRSLCESKEPLPVGKDFFLSMINAGELKTALEILIDCYHENEIQIGQQFDDLVAAAKFLHLSKQYLETLNELK